MEECLEDGSSIAEVMRVVQAERSCGLGVSCDICALGL